MGRTNQTAHKSTGGGEEIGSDDRRSQETAPLPSWNGIRKYRKSKELLIRKLPFQRLVREIAQDFKTDLRGSRAMLSWPSKRPPKRTSSVSSRTPICVRLIHAKRVTIMPKDIRLSLSVLPVLSSLPNRQSLHDSMAVA